MIYASWSGVRRVAFREWRNGNDHVCPLLVVDAIHVEKNQAFVDAKLRALTDG
jgi:hypothetical protein